jgi:hypothetical protein
MRMNFDVAGINHQPIIIWIINQSFQQGFPNAAVTPTAKSAMCVLPITL